MSGDKICYFLITADTFLLFAQNKWSIEDPSNHWILICRASDFGFQISYFYPIDSGLFRNRYDFVDVR